MLSRSRALDLVIKEKEMKTNVIQTLLLLTLAVISATPAMANPIVIGVTCKAGGGPATIGSEQAALFQRVDQSYALAKQADMQAKTDTAKAIKTYRQALDIFPDCPIALFGLGDCMEKLTGDPKAAIPYYRKVLFAKSVGKNTADYADFGDSIQLNAALLFERAGELDDAKILYNSAATRINKSEQSRFDYLKKHTTEDVSHITNDPGILPILTDKSTAPDVACYANVGLGITDANGALNEEPRAHFEEAVAIKDCDVARYYLNKHKKEHPEAYVNDAPKPQQPAALPAK